MSYESPYETDPSLTIPVDPDNPNAGTLAGHHIMSPSNTFQDARQMEIEPISKDDPRISAADNDKVSGKSILVTGSKKVEEGKNENATREITVTYNITDEYDSDKVEAWLDSDNVLYLYVPAVDK
ncbi:uncharacterized protein LOC106646010 [Copidosoma floridanum]|uniref:uncharacterized protein LOC106646010 n=1 Tax=Copidosoma floridanum TaxID=29053 RepID=UPI0006C97DED|nr:uncharacterized protein LOC106646010 [Copidosoma floridanum]